MCPCGKGCRAFGEAQPPDKEGVESAVEFWEQGLEVEGETGPGMSVRQHGESRMELRC